MRSPENSIKRNQKEALYFRTISNLIAETCRDDSELVNFFVTRVQLSPDGGVCTIYIYSPAGSEYSHKIVGKLIIYKPSLRKALAASVSGRRVPEIIFAEDTRFQKRERLEAILDSLTLEERERAAQELSDESSPEHEQ